MHKLLLIIAITFNFCNGMEPQEKRVYNPEATEKLREILNTTRLNDFSPPMEKLISCIPQFLSDLIISPKPLRLRSSWPQEIETLVKQGADPNINLNSSRYQNLLTNPLSLALDNFRYDLLDLLLRCGANPNSGYQGNSQLPVLSAAAFREDSIGIEILLVHGANPKFQLATGETAQDMAYRKHNKELLAAEKQKIP